jgi:hypothetical protein
VGDEPSLWGGGVASAVLVKCQKCVHCININMFTLQYLFRLAEVGTNMSSIVRRDSNTPLSPYNSALSAHPYFISFKNSGPHTMDETSFHLLPYTCLLRNGDIQCPLVITLLANEHVDIVIRVTEPHYPRSKAQTVELIRLGLPTADEPYSYSITVTLSPGFNHVSWCASAPVTFSESLRYFPYHRPNIRIFPHDPSVSIQYFASQDSTSARSPYIPTPYTFLSPYSFPSASHPPSLGVVSSGVASLLHLSTGCWCCWSPSPCCLSYTSQAFLYDNLLHFHLNVSNRIKSF